MRYQINGETYDGNAYSLQFDNDMMNGVLIDMEQSYCYLSDQVPEHAAAIEAVENGGDMECYDLTDTEINWTNPPHSWVFNSMVKIIVGSAEELCKEACGE